MALQHLLEALERDARAEAERVLAAARGAAEEIRSRAETAVGQRRAEALNARSQALRAEAAVGLAVVRRRARGATLDARHQLLERVRAAARERIATMEGDPASLGLRLQAALASLGDRAAEIRCAPALADAVRALVRDRANTTVVAEAASTEPLVVRAADGTMDVDASLAGLFERRWPELAVELMRDLEAER